MPAAVAVAGTGVGASRRGVAEGVAGFDTFDESAEEGRCGSCRKLAWRGWELQQDQPVSIARGYVCLHFWNWRIGRSLCDDVEIILVILANGVEK